MMRLGAVYQRNLRFARAALAFARAADLRPDSAAAWFALGQSHEADYDYAAASKEYRRAHMLAPENRYYATVAANFEARTKPSPAPSPAVDGTRDSSSSRPAKAAAE